MNWQLDASGIILLGKNVDCGIKQMKSCDRLQVGRQNLDNFG